MLTNLDKIKFIGDLSLQDADILAKFGRQSKSIIEFGSGGSTQIFSQCGCNSVTSIETDPNWINLTKKRLSQLNEASVVEFFSYTHLDKIIFGKQYDLIFVDGVDHLRREFAITTWKYLQVGGVMIFHDTRRFNDFQNVAWIAQLYFNEINRIDINLAASDGISSNMTVIHKKSYEPYQNWNHTENKPLWAYGSQPNTEDIPLWSQNS